MGTHVLPREIPRPAELGRPVHPGENGELMAHLAEIAALCGRLQSEAGVLAEPGAVFAAALPVLRRLVEFRATALFTVDEGGMEFSLAGVDPPEAREALERELHLQVDDGTFTWALYRNNAVLVPSLGRRGRVLMHAVSTTSDVQGMFFGVLPAQASFIPEVTRELISIVLFTCAGVLESGALHRRLTSYSEELEATVRTRTRALRSSEEEAREANRVKSEFLAHTSHEIRAPINGIVGTLSLLERTPLAPEQRAFVETIDRSARVLLRLAGDVLDLSRIEAGRMQVERGPMRLREVVDGAVELVAPRARKAGLDLWVQWDRHLPLRMVGDGDRVRQIVTNLLDNAVKFTTEGEIEVRCEAVCDAGAEAAVVRVRDTGPGIAPADRDRIFDRFTQGSGGSRRDRGSGLGLAIARDLARLMGGDLVLERSDAPGSCFRLTLPVTLGEPANPAGAGSDRALLVTRSPRLAACLAEEAAWAGSTLAVLESLEDAAVYLADDDVPPPLVVDRELVSGPTALAVLPPEARVTLLGAPGSSSALYGVPSLPRPWLSSALRRALGSEATVVPDRAAAPPAPSGGLLAGLRVLVVDDDAVTRTVLGWMLEELGCAHAEVATGEEALAHLAGVEADVVLMDSHLPDLSGEETTRHIVDRVAQGAMAPVRVVGVTGRSGPEARAELLDAGMEEVLVKPVTLQVIARTLAGARRSAGAAPVEDTLVAAGMAALAQVWPERRRALDAARADGNLTVVAQEAHRMKGAGGLVGAHEVADVAAALEMSARTGNQARVVRLLPELDQVVEAFLAGAEP